MFKKENLKTGMVVEFNNHSKRLVFNDKLIDFTGFIYLSNINDKLKNVDSLSSEYIIAIYKINTLSSVNDLFKDSCLTKIWSIKK